MTDFVGPEWQCRHGQTQHAIWAYCPMFFPGKIFDMLLTIHFLNATDGFRVYFGFCLETGPINDILTAAEPIGIVPGLNLRGWSSVSFRDRILDQTAATIGIPQVRNMGLTQSLAPNIITAPAIVSSGCSRQSTGLISRFVTFTTQRQ